VAATAAKLGVSVTVVDVAPAPMSRAFGPTIGRWFTEAHSRNGVEIRCGTSVECIDDRDGAPEVVLAGGDRLSADVVVVGIGGVPAIDWLVGTGVDLANGVLCAPDLQTTIPGIVAAGDVAVWHNNSFDETMRVEHWTNALEQGRHAAGRLLGDRTPFSSIPYFWTDQFDLKLRFVGRADPTDDIVIETQNDKSLVALFGRGGILRGAVCVNAPRKLAQYRSAIGQSDAWMDAQRTA
jgi:NADPH-dependent 2,4-dienoyl-CoA reductase/sulfur reductase-like enzyme